MPSVFGGQEPVAEILAEQSVARRGWRLESRPVAACGTTGAIVSIDRHTNMIVEIALLILEFGLSSFLISLPFLYDLSPKFRYYFKFFVYYWLLVLVNLVLAPVATWTWTPIRRSNPA